MRNSIVRAILIAGFSVGLADILLAFLSAYVNNGTTPDRVLRFVASGVFGTQAFKGGNSMILLGLLFHFSIAFIFTLVFFFIYPRIRWIDSNKIITGIFYGLLVWTVMNLIVVPLSNTPPLPFRVRSTITGMLILIAAIGLPLTYFAHQFYSQKN